MADAGSLHAPHRKLWLGFRAQVADVGPGREPDTRRHRVADHGWATSDGSGPGFGHDHDHHCGNYHE
ncbi:MAG TPA: hypothetical protein VGC11_07860 [Acidimicrobiia bacterium]